MGLFSRKRQKDEADLIYEQAKQRGYAREVKHIAARKGYNAGRKMAEARFNQPVQQPSFMSGFRDGVLKYRGQLEHIANSDIVGMRPEDIPLLQRKKS
jgi:hypothetical protein